MEIKTEQLVKLTITPELMAQGRADFRAIFGMTPEEFWERQLAKAMAWIEEWKAPSVIDSKD